MFKFPVFFCSSHQISVLSSSFPFLALTLGPWPSILAGFVCFFLSSQSFKLLFSFLLIFSVEAVWLWIRDLVRETAKKCSLVPLGVFIFGFALFVLSEAILFVSIFWASFHFTSSPFFSFQEALFLPDPCELTYGNTLLLSNAAVSLGSAYITRENLVLFGSPHSALQRNSIAARSGTFHSCRAWRSKWCPRARRRAASSCRVMRMPW